MALLLFGWPSSCPGGRVSTAGRYSPVRRTLSSVTGMTNEADTPTFNAPAMQLTLVPFQVPVWVPPLTGGAMVRLLAGTEVQPGGSAPMVKPAGTMVSTTAPAADAMGPLLVTPRVMVWLLRPDEGEAELLLSELLMVAARSVAGSVL